MTVSVHVQPVSGSQLKTWLTSDDFKVLLLDCRSFVYYNNHHIVNAHNVHCPLLLKRRSNGPLPLDHLVPCPEARARLLAGFYPTVLVYDEQSQVVSHGDRSCLGQTQSNITWVLETLFQEPLHQLGMETCFLVGGFNQFSLDCPSMCVSTPSAFSMPSPPPAPISLTPPPVNRKPTDQRTCITPTPTSSTTSAKGPRSPRTPLLRRGPALSLPNLQCINAPGQDSNPSNAAVRPSTPMMQPPPPPRECHATPHAPRGNGYECNAPVRLLPHLYLGSNFHASRLSVLEEHGITAVLNVSRLPNYFPTCFRYMQILVDDNTDADLLPWFEEANNFIETVRSCQGRVLVHCHAGISRSATICLAYLMKARQICLEEAFEFVRSERTVISPNLAFMLQLLRFEDELSRHRKARADENAPPCGRHHSNNTAFLNSSTCNSSKYSESRSSSVSSVPMTAEKGAATRHLSLGSSPLLLKRMARSISLPSPLVLTNSSSTTSCSTSAPRKSNLTFNFNLPVLPPTGARSCALECPELSPTPSPLYSPM